MDKILNKPSMFLLMLLVFTGQLSEVFSQEGARLSFSSNMDGYRISEKLTVGTQVYTLVATAHNGASSNFRFSIQSVNNEFEVKNPSTGDVFLAKKLDYESSQQIRVNVSVTNGVQTAQESVTVNVVDANDEAPYFTQEIYEISLMENTVRNTLIFQNLTVRDPDSTNKFINVECVSSTEPQFRGACDTFGLAERQSIPQLWRGDISLRMTLDAESQNTFYIQLRAYDGILGESLVTLKTVKVIVNDIQDTPPVWQPSQVPTIRIREDLPISQSIINMSAADGDVTNKRAVQITLVSNPDNLFGLQQIESGKVSIFVNKQIKRDNPVFGNSGSVQVSLKACEILPNGNPSTKSIECSTANVTVLFEDGNYNTPVFNSKVYETRIVEDIPVNTQLSSINLVVTDKDQGNNAMFELVLQNHANMFSVIPSSGTKDLTASVIITNTASLDYESQVKFYELVVVARETKTAEAFSSSALVRIQVIDVNDNPPQFSQSNYTATVSERANAGTPVIRITATDKDSARFGQAGLWYKLVGNGADRFRVDLMTGQVTVAPCVTPGSGTCLDAEQTSTYELTFMCADNYGEGYTVQVPLTINILDQNDNSPIFEIPNIVSFITEGETVPDPKVQMKATDADVNDVITYSIISGNPGNLWQIGSVSGVVEASRPVDYEAIPGNLGRYILTVEATDGINRVTGQVTINVFDTNDHTPSFLIGDYLQEISEVTPPGTFILTVIATDQDPSTSPNGQIRYRISQGGQDKFSINSTTGSIFVAPLASFDYEIQNRYNMKVIAADQGSPQKEATANVVILIRDVNNKKPFFQPSSVRETVREDASIGTFIVKMNATDPDKTSSLVYFIEEPITAVNPKNEPVDPQQTDFKSIFNIERLTGIVRVNRTLSYDTVARYQAIVKTKDNAGTPDQTATAILIITILPVNKIPPIFGYPWSPSNPFITHTVDEGQPAGTYVFSLVATDPTDAVGNYQIISDRGNNFNINPTTGVVSIKTPLDYEIQRSTQLIVIATDNGQPALSSTATVLVNIGNINDETPTFIKEPFQADFKENAPNGTFIVQIMATDLDLGDYGIVRYSLDDPLNRFTIDPLTGRLTVIDGSLLDREASDTITLTVTAYDSPNNPDVRRFATTLVLLKLSDVNDNKPSFPQQEYIAVILESVPSGSPVVQVAANDNDAPGPNSKLTYYIMHGDPLNLFHINPSTGLISTNGSIIGYYGTYNLTIGASDSGSPTPLIGTTRAKIQVLQANNGPPVWVIPKTTNTTVDVVEGTYKGKEVIDVHAEDKDSGLNGEVEYGLIFQNQFVTETPNFEINPNTGQITAKVTFDREQKDSYTLLLAARDKGDPPYTSTTFLFVKIVDANDNNPEFPQFVNCCSIPGNVSKYEDTPLNSIIGNVTAFDADIGIYAEVFYNIIAGNSDGVFQINHFTGQITLAKSLDHERQNFYNLTVQAIDRHGTGTKTIVNPNCLCKDPSKILVYIHVLDRNDFPPKFPQNRYHACVPLDAELGKRVAIMKAIDPDSGTSAGVKYNIISSVSYNSIASDSIIAPNNSFMVGKTNGSVYTNTLMVQYENHYFVLGVQAYDIDFKAPLTQLYVWVTKSDQEVTMTFEQPPAEVEKRLEDILKMISQLTDGGIVCVGELTYHVNANNIIDRTKSDLTFHVINNGTLVIMPPGEVIAKLDGNMAVFGMLAIAESYTYWDGFVIDPVLAAVIIIFILLFLALLLLCCLCWCLSTYFRRKETYAYENKPLYLGTINPLWGQKFYEDQELHMAVKEFETVEPTIGAGVVNKAFEEDVVDAAGGRSHETYVKETRTSYNYESSNINGGANGQLTGTSVRIEAPLEGDNVMVGAGAANRVTSRSQYSSYGDVGGGIVNRNVISTATMTDDDMSDVVSSKAPSKMAFGATLTRPDHQQERVFSDHYSDFGEYRQAASVSGAGSTKYKLYTGGPHSVQIPSTNAYNTMFSTEEIGHDMSADMFSSQGYIDQIDSGPSYQGEIHVAGATGPQIQTTYVERRETRQVLN